MSPDTIDILFESSSHPMWICCGNDFQIRAVNDAALSALGYSKCQMMSLESLKDFFSGGNLSFLNDGERKICKCITKNRQPVYLELSSLPVEIESERCVLVIGRKVSLAKRQEQKKYRTSKQLMDLLIEKLPGTFYILDPDGDLLRWNKYLEDITEYTHEEVRAMNALDFFSSEEQLKIGSAIQQALTEGYVEVESKIQSKSGSEIPLLFKASKVIIEGSAGILGIGIDISQLKAAQKEASLNEKLLQTIIDQSQSVIYIKDASHRYRFVSRRFVELTNISQAEILDKKDDDLLDVTDIDKIHQSDQRALQENRPVEVEEEVTVDGTKRTYLTTKIPLKHIGKYENCIFGLSTDITQRKQTEQLLKKSLEEKNVLLSEIHHRVKNNLAVISGLMELQAMQASEAKVQNILRDTQTRIQSMALTHEILYQEQQFAAIDLQQTIRKLVQSLKDTFNANVNFKMQTEAVALNINQAIPSSLIINEVLTNALKHAFEGQPNPSIAIELHESNGTVVIEIRDNGKGLPEDISLESPKSLGLQLINTLITQLKGEVNYRSQHGTIFELRFEQADVKGSSSNVA